jgi:hypothetical protein
MTNDLVKALMPHVIPAIKEASVFCVHRQCGFVFSMCAREFARRERRTLLAGTAGELAGATRARQARPSSACTFSAYKDYDLCVFLQFLSSPDLSLAGILAKECSVTLLAKLIEVFPSTITAVFAEVSVCALRSVLLENRGILIFVSVITACASRTGAAASVDRRRREPARAISPVRQRQSSSRMHTLWFSKIIIVESAPQVGVVRRS